MQNFVISLKDAVVRRNHIRKEFDQKGIDFIFFDAIDKSNINEFQSKYNIRFCEENFTLGEKACFASHVVLWEYCVSNNLKYIVILEDDVLLSTDSRLYLNNLKWIPEGIDVIKIEKFEKSVTMSFKSINIKPMAKLRILQQYHMGTAGYILSFNGARKLLDQVKNTKQSKHIDQLIFNENIYNNFMTVYQMLPALTIQTDIYGLKNLPSQIQIERENRQPSKLGMLKIKSSKNILIKIKKELLRVINRTKKVLWGHIKINISEKN